jgi:hypothetical protein
MVSILKLIMLRTLFPCLLVVLTQCTQKNNQHLTTDGGFCEYDSAKFKAKIIEIRPTQNQGYDSLYQVKLLINGHYRRDTIFLNSIVNHEINASYLRDHYLKAGKEITGMGFYRRTGTCTPEIYRFDEKGL